MPLSSALCAQVKPFNATLQRFDARYFHIDFPLSAAASIIADDATRLTVRAECRSNRDLVGVIWSSADTYDHPYFAYEENVVYGGAILAFVANPRDPYSFSVTITKDGEDYIYRLYPFYVNGSTVEPYVTNATTNGSGPGTSYPVSQIFPNGAPTVESGYYIFVLDFGVIHLGYNYDEGCICSDGIERLFFPVTSISYGLAYNATINKPYLAQLGDIDYHNGASQVIVRSTATTSNYTISGVLANLRLSGDDQLTTTIVRPGAYVGMSGGYPVYTAAQETLTLQSATWTGLGTSDHSTPIPTGAVTTAWLGGNVEFVGALHLDTPIGSESVEFVMHDISVTGVGATINTRYHPQPSHSLKMTTGYDDTYNITPWRQVHNIVGLGYRDDLTIYMGMSHYFKASSYGGYSSFENRIVQTATEPLNIPTQYWCADFFERLADEDFRVVWSTSFEILASAMYEDWKQRDYADNIGLSGWSPPSAFMMPTHPDAMAYLARVIKQGLGIMSSAGLSPLAFQIGEPWWWDGSYSNGAPCIYGDYTKTLYYTETGQYAQTPYIQSYLEPVTTTHRPYLTWLGEKLGEATDYIRDTVKAAYPSAEATLLFFTPQIMNPASEMLTLINFPVAAWEYPAYDFVQIEDYDWVIAGRFDLLPQTLEAATDVLGYSLEVVHYFTGFVLLPSERAIWANVNRAIAMALDAGIPNVYVWAYPQVVRDGILFSDAAVDALDAFPYFPDPSGYRYTVDAGLLRTSFPTAHPRQRRQSETRPKQFEVSYVLPQADMKAAIDFLQADRRNWFTAPLLSGDAAGSVSDHRVRVIGEPSVSALGSSLYRVTVRLEGYAGSACFTDYAP